MYGYSIILGTCNNAQGNITQGRYFGLVYGHLEIRRTCKRNNRSYLKWIS